ncbi:hypothetical protein DSO57_1028595 [Entomophthora muscae]|uniref:Uncharacterized protein n=1 Tax=Entomophthora muscae TaxID=34485 RepID=A0ACC2TNL3_9FUNG|nr:hypothetical protein DSO57_1028595 [Entomophthora muscae]
MKTDFNTGIGLTFFKRAIPLEYCMTIEECNIEDLNKAYNLVEKVYCIKVENLPDEKVKKDFGMEPVVIHMCAILQARVDLASNKDNMLKSDNVWLAGDAVN